MDENKWPEAFHSLMADTHGYLDQEALEEMFTRRVEELMRDDLGLLLSSLYRLDVEEHKIQWALKSTTVPAAQGIARLIIERQKERIETRKSYSGKNPKDWEGL